ncbi:MAG: DUF1353 domain-containing protein [Opitutaceae bacterium]|jgi:hypothetical protein|nr:DUF1353 domain-containing protein [Opitutaceae bacterium]
MPALGKFPFALLTETILGEERQLELAAPFVFESDTLGKIELEDGFVTDMASIPRLFWRIFPPSGRYTAAAIVHDWLYWFQAKESHLTPKIRITRKQADNVLMEAMTALGVPWLTRQTIYRAVRVGGGIAWRGNYERRTGQPYPKNNSDLMPDFYRNRHVKK